MMTTMSRSARRQPSGLREPTPGTSQRVRWVLLCLELEALLYFNIEVRQRFSDATAEELSTRTFPPHVRELRSGGGKLAHLQAEPSPCGLSLE